LNGALFFEQRREPMLTGRRFQLKERTLAIEVVDSERRAVSIPLGAIIKVLSSNDDRTVDALWGIRKVEIFTCDVNIRGTEIKDENTLARFGP
jgi:hypothetical protein